MILVALGVAALVGFYVHGSFDRLLSGIGLNFHECARNGFGATFCGNELDRYRERIGRAKEATERVKANLEESERKSREEAAARERSADTEARERRTQQINSLREKMAREKRIVESEPEGSVASDLARGEYEGARAELQQLLIEQSH
jgi:uncharacterized membrane protein YhiD involved in acid resistance